MDTQGVLKGRTKVYYDGLCYLCSFEIAHYQKMKGSDSIDFIDITGPHFDAAKEQLDPFKIHESLHVRDASGDVHTGVDAFIEIWQQIPSCRWLAKAAQKSVFKTVLNAGYAVFAEIRPKLPRRSCEHSPYCVK